MELLQLQYFKEAARLQHMSKAADALCISQPSLSQTIKRLEEELGLLLFDRKGRNIVLNDAGKIFLQYVDQVFQSLENASLELSSYKAMELNQVSLCIDSASALLPELLARIKKEIPHIRLHIYQKPDSSLLPKMDYILSSSWEQPDNPETLVLLKEPIVAALPKHHPLAKKSRLLLSDVASEEFISLNHTSTLYQIIDHYCRMHQFHPNITTYVDNPGTMRDLLGSGLGIAFIPTISWKGLLTKGLAIRAVSDLPMERFVTLTKNNVRFQTTTSRQCQAVIQNHFKELR